MSELTENLLTSEIQGIENINIPIKNNNINKVSYEDNFDDNPKINNINLNDNKKNCNEIVILNGSCDYNCAVSILTIPKILYRKK